jgi:hypothetical protein
MPLISFGISRTQGCLESEIRDFLSGGDPGTIAYDGNPVLGPRIIIEQIVWMRIFFIFFTE